MAEYHNLERAAQQLQQRFVSLQRLGLGLDVLLGGVLAALLATILTTLLGWSVPLLVVYGAITLVAVGVFAGLAWRVRSAAFEVLARADQTLGFHASLSTAYEYLQQHATNPFVPGLAAVAERLAPRVDRHRVLPVRVPRRVWGIPILLAATLVFPMLKVTPLRFDDTHEPDVARQVSREGQRLEKWGRGLEELAKREQLDRSMILARQMQQLGQRLQREGSEQGQVAERIATLSQYLQRLQQELRERALMSSDTGAMAPHDVLRSGKSVKQELRDILTMLQNEALPRDAMSCNSSRPPKRWNISIGRAGPWNIRPALCNAGGRATPPRAVPGHRQSPPVRIRWIWAKRACSLSICLAWRTSRHLGRSRVLALRRRLASRTIRRCASQSNRRRTSRCQVVRAPCG